MNEQTLLGIEEDAGTGVRRYLPKRIPNGTPYRKRMMKEAEADFEAYLQKLESPFGQDAPYRDFPPVAGVWVTQGKNGVWLWAPEGCRNELELVCERTGIPCELLKRLTNSLGISLAQWRLSAVLGAGATMTNLRP